MIRPKENPLRHLSLVMLKGKRWRYLRYLHLREVVAQIASEVETVCVCGAGHGFAEVALAVEFPHLHFTLTDIIAGGYPNYHRAMAIGWDYGINNVQFSIWDVLRRTNRRFDLVCSTEMLEHIQDDKRAAANMVAASKRFVYCLVPFADEETNANARLRAKVLETHGHFVAGYDAAALTRLFPRPRIIAGTYWADAGRKLRAQLTDMEPPDIEASFEELVNLAGADLIPRVPARSSEASGIKILAQPA